MVTTLAKRLEPSRKVERTRRDLRFATPPRDARAFYPVKALAVGAVEKLPLMPEVSVSHSVELSLTERAQLATALGDASLPRAAGATAKVVQSIEFGLFVRDAEQLVLDELPPLFGQIPCGRLLLLSFDCELPRATTADDEVDGDYGRSSSFVRGSSKVERGGGDPQAVEESRVAPAHRGRA